MSNEKSFPIFILIGFCLILLSLLIAFYPKPAKAEIATPKDWIGLFQITSPTRGHTKGETFNGNSWVYANNCTQSITTNPSLSRSCPYNTFTLPSTGSFEYRLYANDGESADTLIAVSKSISTAALATPIPVVNCPTQATNPRVQAGLITANSISNKFGNTAANCVIGSSAPYTPFKIPTYNDLKSFYYTQSKINSVAGNTGLSTFSSNPSTSLFNITGDLTINTNITHDPIPMLVFIDGNLYIDLDSFTFGNTHSGVVFVVNGDVKIKKTVTRIDAVIISTGKIYTAVENSTETCNSSFPVITPSQLTVNGSLVSLDSSKPIEFCRSLGETNTNTPAEKIINQSKYLVILKDLYSDTLQKWSEI